MSAGSLLEILEVYFEAFAETDAARRPRHLAVPPLQNDMFGGSPPPDM